MSAHRDMSPYRACFRRLYEAQYPLQDTNTSHKAVVEGDAVHVKTTQGSEGQDPWLDCAVHVCL